MGRRIDDGLIRGWGLSQVDADVIDRVQHVTLLSAIRNIYSMVKRDSEAEIIPYCMEHKIGFVPFSPKSLQQAEQIIPIFLLILYQVLS